MQNWIDLPPVWLAICAAIAWLTREAGVLAWSADSLSVALGTALIAVGVALTLLTVREFAKARTTVIPHRAPDTLVTSGPLGWSRNPIYLADLLILLGLSLIWGSLVGIMLTPVLAIILTRRFILPEEARLTAAFPDAFAAYAARVRRW